MIIDACQVKTKWMKTRRDKICACTQTCATPYVCAYTKALNDTHYTTNTWLKLPVILYMHLQHKHILTHANYTDTLTIPEVNAIHSCINQLVSSTLVYIPLCFCTPHTIVMTLTITCCITYQSSDHLTVHPLCV